MRRALFVLLACAGRDVTPSAVPAAHVIAAMPAPAATSAPQAMPVLEPPPPEPAPSPPSPPSLGLPEPQPSPEPASDTSSAEVWLKGDTHVHGRASGDSSEPYASVIAWYEQHHYDFIAITDHNRVSELDGTSDTRGQVTLRDPRAGLIVLSGIELTHNPIGCLPAGDPSGNCRIHVNLLGPTARPGGRLEWAERHSHARVDMYHAAQVAQSTLGGIAQLNHPQWLWGMTPDLLVELADRGMVLIEIANSAFASWNAGDAAHPSTEALWDAALLRGATLWGTASDDAHDYDGHGKYPPGGGWIVVRARREPQAILDALAAGRFYASNGVALSRAEVDDGDLVVAVDPETPATVRRHVIEFIENGRRVDSIAGEVGRHAVPATGYVRAVVTRDDGKRAWVQPARRPAPQPMQ